MNPGPVGRHPTVPELLTPGRSIPPREVREPAKMVGHLLVGLGDDWQFQASTDRARMKAVVRSAGCARQRRIGITT